MEGKVKELEEQKTTAEGKAKLYETQIAALEDQKNLLADALKLAMEHKVDIEPLKKHDLTLRKNIHQMQLQMMEKRFKVQQIDIRLEEIVNTTSYFLDRTQDILETLQGRMTWVETNKESPADTPIQDLEMIKLDYELIEYASNVAEELKKDSEENKECLC